MADFLLYEDKSSIEKKNSRLLQGGLVEERGRFLAFWEPRELRRDTFTDERIILTREYDGRPDLVAFDLYGKATLGWLILQYNNIVDPTTEFIAGKTILAPSRARVQFEIVSRPLGTTADVNTD